MFGKCIDLLVFVSVSTFRKEVNVIRFVLSSSRFVSSKLKFISLATMLFNISVNFFAEWWLWWLLLPGCFASWTKYIEEYDTIRVARCDVRCGGNYPDEVSTAMCKYFLHIKVTANLLLLILIFPLLILFNTLNISRTQLILRVSVCNGK